jgi:hypothetical protein
MKKIPPATTTKSDLQLNREYVCYGSIQQFMGFYVDLILHFVVVVIYVVIVFPLFIHFFLTQQQQHWVHIETIFGVK